MNIQTLIQSIQSIDAGLKAEAGKAVNRLLTIRNWLIGYYIVEYEQKGEDRAQYGEKLLKTLAERLNNISLSYGNLKVFRQFYFTYPQIRQPVIGFLKEFSPISQSAIVQLHLPDNQYSKKGQSTIAQSLPPDLQMPPEKLITRLSYTHMVQLLPIDDPLKRTFYEVEAIKGSWSVRELKRQINSLYFERMGLSKDKEKLARLVKNNMEHPAKPTDFIKNIYAFEFLGLPQRAVVEETDLEHGLLDHLQEFLLELGHGFCLEARQKRILIGDEYFFIDLVFYHRLLKCHVLVELKVEEFTHVNVGQLNTYLNFYKQEMMQPDDNLPVGILLVTDKNNALVQYATAGMDQNLFVKKYLLQLPGKEQLENFIKNEIKEMQ